MSSSSAHAFADQVRDHLADFAPVSLDAIGQQASQDRCDTKFLLPQGQLLALLDALRQDYRVLEVGGARLHRYRTLYFDTAGFDLCRRHQRSSRSALKVRSRQYVDSGRSFFELKRKIGPRRSVKARTETPDIVTELTAAEGTFIAAHARINTECLQPTIWNRFERITLASKTCRERVTLDVGVHFKIQSGAIRIPGVVVGELKQERFDRASAFFRHMRTLGSRPTGFSKYCVGAVLLYPQLKRSQARPKLRMLAKLAQGNCHAA
jgi:hypothetical protein